MLSDNPIKSATLFVLAGVVGMILGILFGMVMIVTCSIILVLGVIFILVLLGMVSVIRQPGLVIVLILICTLLGYGIYYSHDIVVWICRVVGSVPKISTI